MPQRTAAAEEHVDEQADHHRRQPHAGVDQDHHQPASEEAAQSQGSAQRHTEDGGDQQRDPRHAQAEGDNFDYRRVAAEDQPDRFGEAVDQVFDNERS